MKFATKAVRAGQKPDPVTGAIVTPIYQTATYVLEELEKSKGYDYSRTTNPTRSVLERLIAEIENAKFGLTFASGMSAESAIVTLLKQGDHVIVSDDVYGGTYRLFEKILTNFGLSFTYVDTTKAENVKMALKENTRMIWVETPSNPLLKISDIEAIAKISKENGILLVVDSTFATPYFFNPLELGADIVIHSTTKYLSGHNQLIGGALATNDERLYEQLKFIQNAVGAVPSAFDCWLTILGIKTLHLRMERHNKNAIEVSKFLESHPKIERVIYPGLKSHPQHEVAKRQMRGFGGVLSFELKGGLEAGKKLMNSVKLCYLAESLGATETMITHPATMTHTSIPREQRIARGITDGLVRLSVGIEDVTDIIADLEQALEKV